MQTQIHLVLVLPSEWVHLVITLSHTLVPAPWSKGSGVGSGVGAQVPAVSRGGHVAGGAGVQAGQCWLTWLSSAPQLRRSGVR